MGSPFSNCCIVPSDDSGDETSDDTDDDEDEGGKKGGQVVDEALATEVTQLAEKRKGFLLTKVRKLYTQRGQVFCQMPNLTREYNFSGFERLTLMSKYAVSFGRCSYLAWWLF